MDIFNYVRRKSHPVAVGKVALGGDNPIRLQSMTTTITMDTQASVAQTERIADAGADYVRLTTQGKREAENMRNIIAALRDDGYGTPVIADVHFNPDVADVAALYCDKVRINPGNYIDPARTFRALEYTDEEYATELKRLETRLIPFLNICREHGTAVRIGVNHGSLSDRIMSRYGDTPQGIVESCMEFLRICKRENFNDVVISIKASNTVVMVRSVRLLVAAMEKEDMDYPLHLGVTEAGEGEDGRIKSAVGIGALLSDGIGDTIRVSLSEEPENEIPVARHLVDYATRHEDHKHVDATPYDGFDYLQPERRKSRSVNIIGRDNTPVAIGGDNVPIVVGADCQPDEMDYIELTLDDVETKVEFLKGHPQTIVVTSDRDNHAGAIRAIIHALTAHGLKNPVVMHLHYAHNADEMDDFQLEAATDMGALMMDGLVDGLWISNDGDIPQKAINDMAFAILQAGRLRTTKTEYISCPGCGRTLYDLRTTIARIKTATEGMKGLKIAIMGCIVNGPGEMADADYGYVGAGRGKISLYHRKVCVEKNIPEEEAVGHLLALIRRSISQNEKKNQTEEKYI